MTCPICQDTENRYCMHLVAEMNHYLVRKRIIQMWHKKELSSEQARELDAKNTFELIDKITCGNKFED